MRSLHISLSSSFASCFSMNFPDGLGFVSLFSSCAWSWASRISFLYWLLDSINLTCSFTRSNIPPAFSSLSLEACNTPFKTVTSSWRSDASFSRSSSLRVSWSAFSLSFFAAAEALVARLSVSEARFSLIFDSVIAVTTTFSALAALSSHSARRDRTVSTRLWAVSAYSVLFLAFAAALWNEEITLCSSLLYSSNSFSALLSRSVASLSVCKAFVASVAASIASLSACENFDRASSTVSPKKSCISTPSPSLRSKSSTRSEGLSSSVSCFLASASTSSRLKPTFARSLSACSCEFVASSSAASASISAWAASFLNFSSSCWTR